MESYISSSFPSSNRKRENRIPIGEGEQGNKSDSGEVDERATLIRVDA